MLGPGAEESLLVSPPLLLWSLLQLQLLLSLPLPLGAVVVVDPLLMKSTALRVLLHGSSSRVRVQLVAHHCVHVSRTTVSSASGNLYACFPIYAVVLAFHQLQ